MSNYYYIDVTLEFEKENDREVTPAFFKKHVIESVSQLFGEVGAAIPVDVLKYNSETRRAILRTPTSHYVKLHSSLTLSSDYEGSLCAYRVHKTSDLLLSLTGNSRTYVHQ